MPIMDNELILCEGQDISGNSSTSEDSDNIVYIPQVKDFKGTAGNDRPNVSQKLNLNIVVEDTDLAAAGDSCALTFTLYADSDATTVTTDGDAIITKAISVNQTSNYPDGTQICSIPLPVEQIKPYLQLKIARATQNLSTGKITAWIGNAIQQGT